MLSGNGIPYDWMLDIFRNLRETDIDETTFYFTGEPETDMHFLGYLPRYSQMPYWAGYCDLPDGFECATAEELFDAPIYSGQSLKQRWNEVRLFEFNGVDLEVFIERHKWNYPLERYQ